jgi:hypothetical protein
MKPKKDLDETTRSKEINNMVVESCTEYSINKQMIEDKGSN